MSVENSDESTPNIEYKNYPNISMAFYSPKHDKVYITPLAKKYPRLNKHFIEHETKHFKCDKKPLYSSVVCHYLLDWIDPIIAILNIHIVCDIIKCGREFSKVKFSKEEIDEFNKEFSVEKYSKYWYLSIINFCIGSTGIITWGYISYFIFSHFFENIFDVYMRTILIVCLLIYSRYVYDIRNIIKKRLDIK